MFRTQLLQSLNGFLAAKEGTNAENPFVLPAALPATSLLLDEFKAAEKSNNLKDDHFYKPYLDNAIRLNDSTALVQVAYRAVHEGIPMQRALFTLKARRRGNQFFFYSPLADNAAAWQYQDFGIHRVYYKTSLHTENAARYFDMQAAYDKKLGLSQLPMTFYCCDDFPEALQLAGVNYKSDYNGYAHTALSAVENGQQLSVNGVFTSAFDKADPHDLWHERLHKVVPTSIINKPVDEGTAYLYGGSWGLSWQEILAQFKVYAAAHPDADWRTLYNANTNFAPGAPYPLNVDYAINALIVQQLEQEKGFDAVLSLLRCGNKVKDNSNYFAALQQLTGVKQQQFNSYVRKLIARA
jgi:hypothetical protein